MVTSVVSGVGKMTLANQILFFHSLALSFHNYIKTISEVHCLTPPDSDL